MKGTSIISTDIGENKYVDLKDKIEAAIELGYPMETLHKLITAPSMVARNNVMAEARHNWDIQPTLYAQLGCSIPKLSLDQAYNLLNPLKSIVNPGEWTQICQCIYLKTHIDAKKISDRFVYYNIDDNYYSICKDETSKFTYITKWNGSDFEPTEEISFKDLYNMPTKNKNYFIALKNYHKESSQEDIELEI